VIRISTHDDLSEICKQSALEEAEGPEPESKERTVTVLKLAEGFGLTEAVISVFEDINCNAKGTARTGQGNRRMRACCEEILKKKEMSLSATFQCKVSLKYLHELVYRRRRHWYCWTPQMTDLQFQRNCLHSKLSFALHFTFFL
jgi:hypothetical protein